MQKIGAFIRVLSVFLILFVTLWAALYSALRAAYPIKYRAAIEKYSAEYNVDGKLMLSIMKNESGFSKNAVSRKNAVGLMQITPETAQWIAEKTDAGEFLLSDPETNIMFSCWYMDYLCGRFSSVKTAVAAYNAGEGNVKRWLQDGRYSHDGVELSKIPYGETSKYVSDVMSAYNIYNKLY